MSASRSRKPSALSLDTTHVSRKYLGEPGDLHFQPKSPLVSRQKLSPRQEEELLKACSSVLEGVPHSDASTVPDFSHLAAHIQVESPSAQPRKYDSRRSDKSSKPQSATSARRPNGRPHTKAGGNDDTATPSTISKHDLFDTTNTTTPLTSTEISPKDILLQFPEKVPGLPVSQFIDLSRAKGNTKPVYPIHQPMQKPSSSNSHASSTVAAKSTTFLPSTSNWSEREHCKSKVSKSQKRHIVRRPEYNKSLPDVPKLQHFYETADDPWATKNASLDLPRRQRTDPVRSTTRTKLDLSDDLISSEKTQIKSRFQFLSIFGRKRSKTTAQRT